MEPYWEDTAPAVSPDGSTVAFGDGGFVWVAPLDGTRAGAPGRARGGAGLARRLPLARCRRPRRQLPPRHLRPRQSVATVRRARQRRLRVRRRSPRTAPRSRSPSGPTTTATAPRSTCWTSPPGATRAVTGTPRMQDKGPAWSPDGTTIAYVLRAQRLVRAASRRRQRVARTASSPHDDADFGEPEWHPDGSRIVATRSRRGHRDLVTVDSTSGAVTQVARGRRLAVPALAARRRDRRHVRRPRHGPAHRAARRVAAARSDRAPRAHARRGRRGAACGSPRR